MLGYRYEAQTIEGFVQQVAVNYVSKGYWFLARHVENLPVRLTLFVSDLSILNVCEIGGLHMRQMNLVHLLLHLRAVQVATLGSTCAVFRISELCLVSILREGRKHFEADDFVEALGGCGELLHVAVIERAKLGPVQEGPIFVVQNDVDRIGTGGRAGIQRMTRRRTLCWPSADCSAWTRWPGARGKHQWGAFRLVVWKECTPEL
jgi:hypothetical protein